MPGRTRRRRPGIGSMGLSALPPVPPPSTGRRSRRPDRRTQRLQRLRQCTSHPAPSLSRVEPDADSGARCGRLRVAHGPEVPEQTPVPEFVANLARFRNVIVVGRVGRVEEPRLTPTAGRVAHAGRHAATPLGQRQRRSGDFVACHGHSGPTSAANASSWSAATASGSRWSAWWRASAASAVGPGNTMLQVMQRVIPSSLSWAMARAYSLRDTRVNTLRLIATHCNKDSGTRSFHALNLWIGSSIAATGSLYFGQRVAQ